jgi:putative glycosyltransferase (TIGR04348 family)
MKLCIVTPAPKGSRSGNRISAIRWAKMLRRLGHRVSIVERYDGRPADVLLALHAKYSADSVRRFHREREGAPIIVALTGTDLYRDLPRSVTALRSLELATRIIVLQPLAIHRIPRAQRKKARVILQSTPAPRKLPKPRAASFDVCVVGHLRTVKDPLRTAMASRRLPLRSRIAVLHAGAALTPAWQARAEREQERNPRYRWLGELSPAKARTLIARSRLMVLSSKMEGGANVIAEALLSGTPVLASAIDGSIGQLGARFPGLFPVGDTAALGALMGRAECESEFLETLARWGRRLAPAYAPELELAALETLLAEL